MGPLEMADRGSDGDLASPRFLDKLISDGSLQVAGALWGMALVRDTERSSSKISDGARSGQRFGEVLMPVS